MSLNRDIVITATCSKCKEETASIYSKSFRSPVKRAKKRRIGEGWFISKQVNLCPKCNREELDLEIAHVRAMADGSRTMRKNCPKCGHLMSEHDSRDNWCHHIVPNDPCECGCVGKSYPADLQPEKVVEKHCTHPKNDGVSLFPCLWRDGDGCEACPRDYFQTEQPTPTKQMPLIVNPANPYPESVFPMQSWELVKAIPDEHLRTATSGCVARYVWNVCCEDWQKLIAEWIPAHDLAVRRAEWRRIFAHMHITRKQLLALPLDIRQDILKQQVDNYVQNLSDEEKLEELRKLD